MHRAPREIEKADVDTLNESGYVEDAIGTIDGRDMVRNDALPKIEVDPRTCAVTVNGTHANAPPAKTLSLDQIHFSS